MIESALPIAMDPSLQTGTVPMEAPFALILSVSGVWANVLNSNFLAIYSEFGIRFVCFKILKLVFAEREISM